MRLILICLFIGQVSGLWAQSANLWLNRDYTDLIQRYRILSGTNIHEFHASDQPWERETIPPLLRDSTLFISERDKFNRDYLIADNHEYFKYEDINSKKPLLRHFYQKKADFYHISTDNFDLHINPVVHVSAGKETETDPIQYINTRGIRVRGSIDDKIGFFTYIGENQMTTPLYVRNWRSNYGVIPNEGFFKNFKESGYDFFEVRGYITANISPSIDMQFGRDNNKIGNGYRSVILSNFSPSYLFLKFNTNVWKINYTNLFAQLTEDVRPVAGGLSGFNSYPLKYMSLHHLSINLTKSLNIGLFESVIYGSEVQPAQPQLKYLNPIIFYRAVEHQNGSSDNVILGMDVEWIAKRGISFYGQMALDEFLLDRIREGNGWWGNKVALQMGTNLVDVAGIKNLDFKGEYNLVRPYTYSHGTPYGSYTHYRQALAHPLGANFTEWLGNITYQFTPRTTLRALLIRANKGFDPTDENWGGNIFLNNQTRMQEEGNKIGQGVNTDINYASLTLSFMIKHNIFADVEYIKRKQVSAGGIFDMDTDIVNIGLRMNMDRRVFDF